MDLSNPMFLRFTFDEICRRGRSSVYPSCQTDGYRTDSVHWLPSGRAIFFGVGDLDDRAVYVGQKMLDSTFLCGRPRDVYYFEVLQKLGAKYGGSFVYADVEYVGHRVPLFRGNAGNIELGRPVLSDIHWLAGHYTDADDAYWAEEALCCTYYGMVAEENKRNASLGSTVKLNGLYKVLKLGVPVMTAADCCRNMPAAEIYDECVRNRIFRDFR